MSNLIPLLDQIVNDGRAAGVGHFTLEDSSLGGRTLTLNGRNALNFGSCSYLGLETNEALVEGTIDAVRRYGTQFSSSRAYASVTLYGELEERLSAMFGRPTLVTASTTLGHLATLPVLVGDNDAVILDHQVHASIQMTVQQLKARGIPATIVRHNDLDHLEKTIRQLKPKHEKIWYFADGVYSMYGDSAPLAEIEQLLDRHEQLHFYVDDAHGMSWTGTHGVGHVRSRMTHHPRMVQAVSLNKAFAAGGGAIIFPDQASAQLVRNCGSTLIFSGPVQPPMLGAAIASARLHMSDGIVEHQEKLALRVAHMNKRLNEAGLPQYAENDTPLFFVAAGLPHLDYELVRRMLDDGFYMNAAVFPAVPMKRGGLRFTVTNHLELSDIDAMVDTMARHYVEALDDAGVTFDDVARTFKIPRFEVRGRKAAQVAEPAATLWCERATSVDAFDPRDWDGHARGHGNFTHAALRRIEDVFGGSTPTADRWPFHYLTVRDEVGNVVLRTFYTAARIKDDMFEPAEVSQQVEAQRAADPNHLTSIAVMLGSMATKGDHLYLDRKHPAWRDAITMLVEEMEAASARYGATQIMIRDFVGERDVALENAMLSLGLAVAHLPDNHSIESLDWEDHEAYVQSLGRRYRSDLRREILKNAEAFEVRTGKMTDAELEHAFALYQSVHARAFELNVYELPFELFRAMHDDDAYDVLRLHVKGEDEAVAVMFSHFEGDDYNAMFVGLDEDAIERLGAYKQILYRTVMRAKELGASRLDLAFTAKLAKRKVGASPQPARAFVRVDDHFNAAVIDALPRGARAA
ncbi:MAG: bifunctional aminotransferase class I/II-fold pyridoxal phosphate-dependent enzyme/GNAT family N-acetyltransferase [Deltaproteobacteria bacterium]|jgi:7-keto-8-aminopelargonate synthetase-like enzyme/predicted N-acyltransferase